MAQIALSQGEALSRLIRGWEASRRELALYDDSLFREIVAWPRVYLQRPHTGDMMQMCADLGVDVPDFQPISYDGKSFRLKPTAAVMVDAEGCTPVSYSQMYLMDEEPRWASR